MPAHFDPYTTAPSNLQIGDYTLLSLACGITREQFKENRVDNLNKILWSLRYAFICGCQRGAAEANDTLEALLKRLPAEAGLPGVEAGLPAERLAAVKPISEWGSIPGTVEELMEGTEHA